MLDVKLIEHIEIEEMPETQVLRLICFEQIETQRLEEQTAVKHITRSHIVFVTLDQIWRGSVGLHPPPWKVVFVPKSWFVVFAPFIFPRPLLGVLPAPPPRFL